VSEFKPNPNFDEELFAQAELQAIVSQKGKEVLAKAIANAQESLATGAAAESIHGKFARGRKGRPHYYVYMDDPGALSIEFGSSHTPAHRPLGKAIRGV
jgi:hypothetical protein